jgi:hypothetical protein
LLGSCRIVKLVLRDVLGIEHVSQWT